MKNVLKTHVTYLEYTLNIEILYLKQFRKIMFFWDCFNFFFLFCKLLHNQTISDLIIFLHIIQNTNIKLVFEHKFNLVTFELIKFSFFFKIHRFVKYVQFFIYVVLREFWRECFAPHNQTISDLIIFFYILYKTLIQN